MKILVRRLVFYNIDTSIDIAFIHASQLSNGELLAYKAKVELVSLIDDTLKKQINIGLKWCLEECQK